MKKNMNKKGFTLVELLAVIVVLAIVMGIAAVSLTNVLDSSRKQAFAASATQYIAGARTLVNVDEANNMLGGEAKYAPKCTTSKLSKYISIKEIKTEKVNDKSPYGNEFIKCDGSVSGTTGNKVYNASKPTTKDASNNDITCSYVKVDAIDESGVCTYTYSVYLSDGVYNIAETEEANLNSNKVEIIKK